MIDVVLCMIRSKPEANLFEFDLEIEKILRVLRKTRRTLSNLNLFVENFIISFFFFCLVAIDMANPDRILTTPDVLYKSLCIHYLNINADFELMFGLIHLICCPNFKVLQVRIPVST